MSIMVQYRLTNQFAKDLKISLSRLPEITCDPLMGKANNPTKKSLWCSEF